MGITLNAKMQTQTILIHKMKNELLPNNTNIMYQLRNSTIPTIQCRTEHYRNSFLPSVVNEWNQLPVDIKAIRSLSIFKHKLNLHLTKSPLYFNVESRE